MKGNRRSATAACRSAGVAVGWFIVLATASQSGANAPTDVGIGKSASLQELYAFLQVQEPDGDWTPLLLPDDCSMEWVVWPNPDYPTGFCLGRWRVTNRDYCRDVDLCLCETFKQCSGRRATDVCDRAGSGCTQEVFRHGKSGRQLETEMNSCRQQSSATASSVAAGGPYHYRWRLSATSSEFVCETQYMAGGMGVVTGPECGCKTARMCECRQEQLASAVELTEPESITDLNARKDPEDRLDDGSKVCETLQNRDLSVTARYAKLLADGAAMSDPESRTAFEYTVRLMHELDLVRPSAQEFVESDLAVPPCGVVDWLTVPSACEAEIPADPLAVTENCARLLSSHVQSQTITEELFGLCTEALRTISLHVYSDPACSDQVKDDVAAFAAALLDKANGG